MTEHPYPEHAKVMAAREEMTTIAQFLKALPDKGMCLAEVAAGPNGSPVLQPSTRTLWDLLTEHYGIDATTYTAEAEQIAKDRLVA